jgi:hypothetical protein
MDACWPASRGPRGSEQVTSETALASRRRDTCIWGVVWSSSARTHEVAGGSEDRPSPSRRTSVGDQDSPSRLVHAAPLVAAPRRRMMDRIMAVGGTCPSPTDGGSRRCKARRGIAHAGPAGGPSAGPTPGFGSDPYTRLPSRWPGPLWAGVRTRRCGGPCRSMPRLSQGWRNHVMA